MAELRELRDKPLPAGVQAPIRFAIDESESAPAGPDMLARMRKRQWFARLPLQGHEGDVRADRLPAFEHVARLADPSEWRCTSATVRPSQSREMATTGFSEERRGEVRDRAWGDVAPGSSWDSDRAASKPGAAGPRE